MVFQLWSSSTTLETPQIVIPNSRQQVTADSGNFSMPLGSKQFNSSVIVKICGFIDGMKLNIEAGYLLCYVAESAVHIVHHYHSFRHLYL